MNPAFGDASVWQVKTDHAYGIRICHPEIMQDAPDPDQNRSQINFAAAGDIAVTIASFEIPRSVFSHTNFVGGSFSVFIHPQIKDSKACNEFRYSDRNAPASFHSGGVQYLMQKRMGAAAGTNYVTEYYHTFQNGFCYELSFNLAEYNTGNEDLGCMVPVMKESDELKVVEPLVAGVSFFQPIRIEANNDSILVTPRLTVSRGAPFPNAVRTLSIRVNPTKPFYFGSPNRK